MKITKLSLQEVMLLEPIYFEDFRGYYCETYSQRTLTQLGIETVFVQDNHFLSLKKGTIRGIHFQNEPFSQAKLIRCTRGSMLDIAVDLRRGSPNYKRWESIILSAENRRQLYIPKGFGHCCMSLTDMTEGQYKVDELYYPEYDRAIAWDDPEIGIDYGIKSQIPIVSPKDSIAPKLSESDVNFIYSGGK